MIELRENAIRYFTDNLVFCVVIDTDNDVSFHVYDKNTMDYIHSYILNIEFDLSVDKKANFLKSTLTDHVCNYYNKQRMKFIDAMSLYKDNENGGIL